MDEKLAAKCGARFKARASVLEALTLDRLCCIYAGAPWFVRTPVNYSVVTEVSSGVSTTVKSLFSSA
jgi:hypothetical protein